MLVATHKLSFKGIRIYLIDCTIWLDLCCCAFLAHISSSFLFSDKALWWLLESLCMTGLPPFLAKKGLEENQVNPTNIIPRYFHQIKSWLKQPSLFKYLLHTIHCGSNTAYLKALCRCSISSSSMLYSSKQHLQKFLLLLTIVSFLFANLKWISYECFPLPIFSCLTETSSNNGYLLYPFSRTTKWVFSVYSRLYNL